MAKTYEDNTKTSKAGLIAHILTSILFLGIGICLLVLSSYTDLISEVVYSFSIVAIGILFICFGAFYMIKYFFNQEFRKISNYGFTMGVILVIIGSVFIFKSVDISTFIDSIICLIGVILGSVMLQNAFALFHIDRSSWFISLIFAIASIAFSIYLLVNRCQFFVGEILPSVFLICVGALSLISLLMMSLGLKDSKKIAQKLYERNLDEAPITAKKSTDDSIFEDEPIVEKKEEKKDSVDVNSPKDDSVFDE